MDIVNIIIYILLGIISLAGLVLTVINLPGIWVIYGATLVAGIMDKFENITPLILVVLFILCLASTFADNIAAALGAKKFGGTGWGMAGAVIGGIVGIFIGGVWGIFLGPLIGAVLFEMIFAKKDMATSLKAGWGTFIGILISMILKLGLSVGIIIFTITKIF
ncbi:DUF456 domain-containing protein [Patescibacteria group bacterium]|nr:DUF456 domain-containing protein [Patescibacteria group bacterium]